MSAATSPTLSRAHGSALRNAPVDPPPQLPDPMPSAAGSGSGPLDAVTVAVYRWALEHGRVSKDSGFGPAAVLGVDQGEVRRALDRLVALRLLDVAADTERELVPVSPEAAVAELSEPIELRIRELEHRAGELKTQVLSVKDVYFASRRSRNRREAVDVVHGVEQLRAVLAGCRRRSRVEILGVFPGPLEGEHVLELAELGFEPLKRGVRVRLLFQHPARVQLPARHLLDRLAAAGCEVRTCDTAEDRVLLFDRETAFLPDRSEPTTTVVVREPATVDFIHRAAEQAWSAAVPYEPQATNAIGYGEAGEELKKAITLLLATGAKDELIARRLSISVRTCRRHIAEIMADLKASSRFQAGVNAVRAGLIPLGDAGADAVTF